MIIGFSNMEVIDDLDKSRLILVVGVKTCLEWV